MRTASEARDMKRSLDASASAPALPSLRTNNVGDGRTSLPQAVISISDDEADAEAPSPPNIASKGSTATGQSTNKASLPAQHIEARTWNHSQCAAEACKNRVFALSVPGMARCVTCELVRNYQA